MIKDYDLLLYELSNRIDKLSTDLVSREAVISHLKECLEKIANDRSPPWDNTDFPRLARECLLMVKTN